MEYKIDVREQGIAIIFLKGRIVGEYQLVDLLDEVDELFEQDCRHIIFNLSDLEYISSAGLSFFLKTLTRVRQKDGEVILVALNELLNSLLVTTKLNAFFIMERTEEDALHYLKEAGIIQ